MNTTPRKGGRMEENCVLNKKEFEFLKTLSEDIYNTIVVADYFVSNQSNIEELWNLSPIIKRLRKDSDKLSTFFINYRTEDSISAESLSIGDKI